MRAIAKKTISILAPGALNCFSYPHIAPQSPLDNRQALCQGSASLFSCIFQFPIMLAHQLFQSMSPVLGQEIMSWMRDNEKDVFKAAITSLAQQRKLRPVFVTRKTKEQQVAWMLETLKLRLTEAIGENVLQVWLMKGQAEMLAAMLDQLGVTHDGKGGVEGDIPSEFDAAKVQAGVDTLLAKYPAESVAVYLHLFQLQQPGGWPAIAAQLESNAKLKLGAA